MIDDLQNPDTIYKFVKADMHAYLKKEAPETNWWVAGKFPPDAAVDTIVRDDMLPDWVREHMRTLDVAGTSYPVSGVGKKIGSVYWISAIHEV